jgi:GC-rich sequence DNA-binding factor
MQLQTRLSSIKDATSAQQQLQDDARRKLAQLLEDEARNKAETEAAADKEAWFREFEEFIISIATFLEQKKPDLQEVEGRWFQQLKMRTSMTGKARANGQVDQMALFFGVPASWPTHVPDDSTNDDSIEDLPSRDGDAFSEVRILRRQTADAGALAGSLLPADQASFELSRETHRKRAEGLLDDVQAAEYRDLAARTQNEDGTTRIHPASLVSRFHRWRRTYAQEYHNAWGGLTLASIADFWIRRSLCAWDVLCCSTGSEGLHRTLHTFPWYSELSHYAEKGHHSAGTEDHSQQDVIGGDDEILAHVITHTVIPYLLKVCGTVEEPAFDPWSSKCNASMLDIVEQLTYVIEKDDTQLQMLISRILSHFKAHVDALSTALNAPPSLAPPAISPQGPTVLLTFTQNTFVVLTKHLLAWNRFVMATQRSAYAGIVDELIAKAVLPLFEMSRLVPGGAEMTAINAKDILARTSRTDLLKQETRTKVEGLASVR